MIARIRAILGGLKCSSHDLFSQALLPDSALSAAELRHGEGIEVGGSSREDTDHVRAAAPEIKGLGGVDVDLPEDIGEELVSGVSHPACKLLLGQPGEELADIGPLGHPLVEGPHGLRRCRLHGCRVPGDIIGREAHCR